MNVTVCPGCLKVGETSFCRKCRRNIFHGKKIDHVLPFSRPDYNRVKIEQAGRISISGVQTKHSLRLSGNRLELTDRGGQYILKPIPQGPFENLEHMPTNEHSTMQLARQVFSIQTAECAVVFFNDDNSPAFLSKRFDVLPDETRLRQEDFAQIARMSEETHGSNYKYDISYEEIALLMKQYVSAYQIEIEKFFKLILFNYLIHNGDAHLKNFSLYNNEAQHNTYLLTPAYDLLNTRLHLPNPAELDKTLYARIIYASSVYNSDRESNEAAMALSLFKADYQTESFKRNGFYARDYFFEFGIKIGIPEIRVNRFLDTIVADKNEMVELLQRSFLNGGMTEQYLEMISDRMKALSYSFTS